MPALTYSEHLPDADLASWVVCFWQIRGVVAEGIRIPHRVLPDGCADLILDLEEARRRGGECENVVGTMSRAQLVGLGGAVDLTGVRLRPGAVAAFSGARADELLDRVLSPGDLSLPLGFSVAELADVSSFATRAQLLTAGCRKRVAARKQPDASIRYALGRWSRPEKAFPSVSVLVRDIGLSERTFERRFVAEVGLTPAHYRRLARFRSVLRLHNSGHRNWADVAAMTGFSDQSHLVREFRQFTGLTPTAWAATQADAAGFLQDGEITAL